MEPAECRAGAGNPRRTCSAGADAASLTYSTKANPRPATARTSTSPGYVPNSVRSMTSLTLPSKGRPVISRVRPGGAVAAAAGAGSAVGATCAAAAAAGAGSRAARLAGGAPAPSAAAATPGRRRFATTAPSARATASDLAFANAMRIGLSKKGNPWSCRSALDADVTSANAIHAWPRHLFVLQATTCRTLPNGEKTAYRLLRSAAFLTRSFRLFRYIWGQVSRMVDVCVAMA